MKHINQQPLLIAFYVLITRKPDCAGIRREQVIKPISHAPLEGTRALTKSMLINIRPRYTVLVDEDWLWNQFLPIEKKWMRKLEGHIFAILL
jgi:hypothetical protein